MTACKSRSLACVSTIAFDLKSVESAEPIRAAIDKDFVPSSKACMHPVEPRPQHDLSPAYRERLLSCPLMMPVARNSLGSEIEQSRRSGLEDICPIRTGIAPVTAKPQDPIC